MQGSVRRVGLTVALSATAVLGFAASASAATFTNATPITFGAGLPNNGSVYPSTIIASGLNGPIADVNVTLNNVSHTWPEDLGIALVGPGGQALLLQSTAGDGTDLVGVTYSLDDQATGGLPSAGAWAAGSYRPTAHLSAFGTDIFPAPGPGGTYANPGPAGGNSATLNGTYANTNPNGTWSLFARDFLTGEGGSIAGGWSLDITVKPDTTAPNTAIESGPGAITNSADASLSFSASEPATFQCRLDAGAFAPCTSPAAFPGLDDGDHTIEIRAVDAYGNVDPSPASRTFTVDTTPPVGSIDSGPSGTATSPDALFTFSASEASSFLCKLDDQPFTACSSPQAYVGLADGAHTFSLRAVDAAGNVDANGPSRTFTVDTTGPADTTDPVSTIKKPKVKKGRRKAVVEFAATDDRTPASALTFTCIVDGGAAAACTSPTTLRRLKPGNHSVTVLATDAAGNTSAPASTGFKIKRKPK